MIARARILALVLAGCGGDDAGPDAEPSPWIDGPAMPGGRLEPGVAAFAGELWVIGGFDDGLAVTNRTFVLDPTEGAWRDGPDAPAALTHLNLAVVGDRLLLLGGLIGTELTPTGECWAFDPADDIWHPLAAMPAGAERGAAAVIVDGTRVVLAGGSIADAAIATVLAYDTVGDAWSTLPDLPSARSHAIGALAADGAALAVGGTATLDATTPLDDVLALAPGGTSWQSRTSMPTARGGCASAVLEGALMCAGGEAGSSALRVTEAYDLAADRWTTAAPLPSGRAGTGGAALDGRLWVPGGAHRLRYEPTGDVESLVP